MAAALPYSVDKYACSISAICCAADLLLLPLLLFDELEETAEEPVVLVRLPAPLELLTLCSACCRFFCCL